jgi:hypothetical protein
VIRRRDVSNFVVDGADGGRTPRSSAWIAKCARRDVCAGKGIKVPASARAAVASQRQQEGRGGGGIDERGGGGGG